MSREEGELSKRAIRMEEIDDLVVKMLDVEEMKAKFPTYEKVAAFREEHFLIDQSMDSLFLSILLEWAWKWLHVNIFTFDKRPIKPEIEKWFGALNNTHVDKGEGAKITPNKKVVKK